MVDSLGCRDVGFGLRVRDSRLFALSATSYSDYSNACTKKRE